MTEKKTKPQPCSTLHLNLSLYKSKEKQKGDIMRRAMKEVEEKMNRKKEHEFDEDEKKVYKHLNEDIKESKKSIKEDKKLKRFLKKEED